MSELSTNLSNLRQVNNEIWEVISELHEIENMDELKQKLISASGRLCTEVIVPMERELEKAEHSEQNDSS